MRPCKEDAFPSDRSQMESKYLLAAIAIAFAFTFAARAAEPACSARSGPQTTALVELYTSEGCDSCPAADHWLSSLFGRGFRPDQVVPLALHVDYWDYIGWKDPFAKGEFSLRQRKLAQLKRPVIVYTPQVLLQGQDFPRWSGGEFSEQVMRINSRPARARIVLAIRALAPDAIHAELSATLIDPAEQKNAAVYLAAYENKLASDVAAGENRGRRLEHDFVVREWIGPIAFGEGAKLEEKRALPLLPSKNPRHLGVAAFVQNRATSDVLQALMLPACAG
ncbi:MAG: DUF1223 domain-containing protein [Betaproteobacteria bacterium]|nr:MAG: DUF1223 domain-containing protein [Betaproteobacteria bacterium]